MNDFSTPRRMSASAFVVLFITAFEKLAGAVFLFVAYRLFCHDADTSSVQMVLRIAISIAALTALALIIAFTKYYFRKYSIEGDKLIFTHGFAAKNSTSIPLSKVHNMRTNRGLFYRIFNLRGIRFDTLADESVEVELILDESDWQKLLRLVSSNESIPRHTDSNMPHPPAGEAATRRIGNFNLAKGAVCQNHLKGFAVLGTILVVLFDKINQLDSLATARLYDYIDSLARHALTSVGQLLCFAAVVYLIVLLLWTGKIALRYGNMTITTVGKSLTIESGLISRFTCRLARDKVTILSIKRNPLERLARCRTVTLRQADNASDTKHDGGIRIYGSMLGRQMLEWWLGDDNSSRTLLSARSGSGLIARRFIPHFILALVVVAPTICLTDLKVSAIIIASLYITISAIRAVMAWKHSRITLTDSYIAVGCGNIARICEYIKYRDIESVGISRTPFTPYTRRVSLRIATNSESVTVYSLKLDDAFSLRNILLDKSAAPLH